jgi:hypothetical protein
MADKHVRKNERVNAEVPVLTERGAKGITRNLSPTGVYFTIAQHVRAGEKIRFSIGFEGPPHSGGLLHLVCVGTVIRVEDAKGMAGVAVAITESRLERGDEAGGPGVATRGGVKETSSM